MNNMNWNFLRNGKFEVLPEDYKRVRIAYTLFDKKMIVDSRYCVEYGIWMGYMDVYAWRELEKPPEITTEGTSSKQVLTIDHGNICKIPEEDIENSNDSFKYDVSLDVTFDFEIYKYDRNIQDNNDLDNALESAGIYDGLSMLADAEHSCSYWYFEEYNDAVEFIKRLNEFISDLKGAG